MNNEYDVVEVRIGNRAQVVCRLCGTHQADRAKAAWRQHYAGCRGRVHDGKANCTRCRTLLPEKAILLHMKSCTVRPPQAIATRTVRGQEDFRPCSCDGTNASCMHCFGRGHIRPADRVPDRVTTRPVRYATRRKPRRHPVSHEHSAPTPTAEAHAPARSAIAEAGASGSENLVEVRTRGSFVVVCRHCGEFAKRGKAAAWWTAHMPACRGLASRRRPELDNCVRCRVLVGKTRLRAHEAHCESGRPPTRLRPTNRHVSGSSRGFAPASAESAIAEQRRDATYGVGSFARERGRFGSHPTYDRMDDEAGA